MVTIIEVARDMGVEMPKETAWAVGSAIADIYVKETKRQPPKELRRKTNGHGSHCFAVYPLTYVPKIMDAITKAGVERERQGSLI
jgi:hypothetical protein